MGVANMACARARIRTYEARESKDKLIYMRELVSVMPVAEEQWDHAHTNVTEREVTIRVHVTLVTITYCLNESKTLFQSIVQY